MTRWFNTAGPCHPDYHYMLPTADRLPQVGRLITQRSYFVLHAPRQTGKTTALLALARALTASGQYTAALVSLETGAAFPDDTGAAERSVLEIWRTMTEWQLPAEMQPPPWPDVAPGSRINGALKAWAQAAPRPLVLFLDEIDALRDDVLISVLRQVRAGYGGRLHGQFPASLALVGLRDVRDYKVASGGSDRLHTSSPFNIKAESLTLRAFTAADVAALYQQHTDDTGQVFTAAAQRLAFDLTQGQPWLVNALARQCVEVLVPDPAQPITADQILHARNLLIERQDTHLDSLAERLREERVRRIIEPILAGQTLENVPADDRQFVVDLGLVQRDPAGGLEIANPIYREVIPRVLASGPQDSLPHIAPTWLTPENRLDMPRLLEAFLAFWRQHGEPLLRAAPYAEVAPHLVLMAFLHRVANAGGTLEREYAIGSGRMDICLRYGPDTLALELKTWRDGKADPLGEGLTQLDNYLSGLGLETGWLVIFDQRRNQPPIAERTTTADATTPQGRRVTVIRG